MQYTRIEEGDEVSVVEIETWEDQLSANRKKMTEMEDKISSIELKISSVELEIRKIQGKIDLIDNKILAIESILSKRTESMDEELQGFIEYYKSYENETSVDYQSRLIRNIDQLNLKERALIDEKKGLMDEKNSTINLIISLQNEKNGLQTENIKITELIKDLISKLKSTKAPQSIEGNFLHLSLSSNPVILHFPTFKERASSIGESSRIIPGQGYLPFYSRFDPTMDHRVMKIFEYEITYQTYIDWSLLFNEACSNTAIKESLVDGIQDKLNRCIETANPRLNIRCNHRSTLSSLNISFGLCSSESYCDNMLIIRDIPLGVIEVKKGDLSLMQAMRQGFLYSTHIAFGLLNRGMKPCDVVVPVIGTNGVYIQFGFTIILEPSYPIFIPYDSLDFTKIDDTYKISKMFYQINKHVKGMYDIVSTMEVTPSTSSDKEMSKSRKKKVENIIFDNRIKEILLKASPFYLKVYNDSTISKGFQLFTAEESSVFEMLSNGFHQMVLCLNRLFTSPKAREYVVFPLTIITPCKNRKVCTTSSSFLPTLLTDPYIMVFDDMSLQGYIIGTPHKKREPKIYDAYIIALTEAVNAIHEAGVLHCDLYPSNIMWRVDEVEEEEEEVEEEDEIEAKFMTNIKVSIKIIDWDIAHTLDKPDFYPKIKEALQIHHHHDDVKFSIEHDLDYIKALSYNNHLKRNTNKMKDMEEIWDGLASNERGKINSAFWELFHIYQDSLAHKK